MNIVQYTPKLQSVLTHSITVRPSMFRIATRSRRSEFALEMRGMTDNVEDSETLDSEAAFIAITQGAVQAFIHVALRERWTKALFDFWFTSAVHGVPGKPCLKKRKPT